MQEIYLSLPIIGKVVIQVQNRYIGDFAIRQLNNYVTEIKEIPAKEKYITQIFIKNDVIINNFKKIINNDVILGREYKIANSKLQVKNFEYYIKDSDLVIKSLIKYKEKWYKRFKKWKYSKSHCAFYDNILYALFSLYAIYDNYFLIHGSLLQYKNKNILFCGLDGVGKSSLTNLFYQKGAKILADNFVLFNGQFVIPFNMAIRLEPNQQTNLEILYVDKNLKEVLPETILNSPLLIDDTYLLTISSKLNIQEEIFQLINFAFFLNLAPEINYANLFIAPLLYFAEQNKMAELKVKKLSIPKGELQKGLEELLNEY